MQQHMQQHQQFIQGEAQGRAPQPQQSEKTIPSARDASNVQAQANNIQSVVRSNAQRVGQAANINTEQNWCPRLVVSTTKNTRVINTKSKKEFNW